MLSVVVHLVRSLQLMHFHRCVQEAAVSKKVVTGDPLERPPGAGLLGRLRTPKAVVARDCVSFSTRKGPETLGFIRIAHCPACKSQNSLSFYTKGTC